MLLALAAGGCAHRPGEAQPFLGTGAGLDHVTILNQELAPLQQAFAAMGFTVTPYGRYENGFENAVLFFSNGTYVELYGVHDRERAAKSDMAHVIGAPDGLGWLIVDVDSTARAAETLRTTGQEVFGPDFIPSEEGWFYQLAGMERGAPGGEFFVIQYNAPRLAEARRKNAEQYAARETHANSAQRLQSAWIAVRDLDAAAAWYERIGLHAGPRIAVPHLGATGREIRTPRGTMLLLESAQPSGIVETFLAGRDAAYMGISVQVASLATARSVAGSPFGAREPYRGLYGRSVLLPAAQGRGVWVELFE